MANRGRLMSIIGGAGAGFGSGFSKGMNLAQRQKEFDTQFDTQQKFQEKQAGLDKERLHLEGKRVSANIMQITSKLNAEQDIKNAASRQQTFENWMTIGGNSKMPFELRKEAWKKIAESVGMSDISLEINKTPEDRLPNFFKGLDALTSMKEVKNESGKLVLTKLLPQLSRFLNIWRDIGLPGEISENLAQDFIKEKRFEEPQPLKRIDVSHTSDKEISREFKDGRLIKIESRLREKQGKKRSESLIARDIRRTLEQLTSKTGRYSEQYLNKLNKNQKLNPYLKGLMNALKKLKEEYQQVTGISWEEVKQINNYDKAVFRSPDRILSDIQKKREK